MSWVTKRPPVGVFVQESILRLVKWQLRGRKLLNTWNGDERQRDGKRLVSGFSFIFYVVVRVFGKNSEPIFN